MKLSIVIPVHNGALFIARCLESVKRCVSGSEADVEVVCVDDGSVDDSLEVIEDLKKGASELGLLVSAVKQPNLGVLAARANGFAASTGAYVWFVDQDDEVVSSPLPILAANPTVDICRFANDPGFDMNVGNKVYRREVLALAFSEIKNLKMRRFEDGVMYAVALKHAKQIVDSPEEIYRYLRRPDSASNMFDPDLVDEAQELLRFCPELRDRLVIYIATQLMRVKAPWREISKVARQLSLSGLAKETRGRYGLAARHPSVIRCYRFLKRI